MDCSKVTILYDGHVIEVNFFGDERWVFYDRNPVYLESEITDSEERHTFEVIENDELTTYQAKIQSNSQSPHIEVQRNGANIYSNT